jgi:alkylation response protein AidB-like acyl-CoA dehydrogenase
MPLYHTEDQAMLANSVSGFMADEGGIKKQLRHWRDTHCKDGFGHGLWKQFAEMGLTGMLAAEEDGGLAMGHVEAGIVLAEIGRNLTPSPFLTTAVMGVTALSGGSADLRGRWLPGVIAGESVLAVAVDEGAKHRPERIACLATRAGNGFRLTGKKDFVVQGASADALIVAARTSGSDSDADGVTLFAVPKNAAGITHNSVQLVDSAMASHVTFDGVELDGDCVIGEVDGGTWTRIAFTVSGPAVRVGCTIAAHRCIAAIDLDDGKSDSAYGVCGGWHSAKTGAVATQRGVQ